MKAQSFVLLFLISILNLSCDKKEDIVIDPNLVCIGVNSSDYFPIEVGLTRIFDNNVRTDIEIKVIKNGSAMYKFQVTDRNKFRKNVGYSFYRVDSIGNIYAYSGRSRNPGTDSYPEQLMLPADLYVGRTWFANDYQPLVDSVESITDTVITPFCTYYNCVRIYKYQPPCKKWEWYVRGYGVVKVDYDCPPPFVPTPGYPPGATHLKELYQN